MSVEVTRLPSGLTVVTDAMPHLQTASLGVWVGSGSRDEEPDEHGISHLLEHMAFKGTARRTARQIAEEIEAVGADLNSATLAEAEPRFASFSGPAAPMPEPARFVGGSSIEARELEQVHVALAMHGVPQRDPSLFSLQVFTSVLGGGMSSRLFQEVREIRGL